MTLHSIPRRHDLSKDCWCSPVAIDDLWFHWSLETEDIDDGSPAAENAASPQKKEPDADG